MTSSSKWNESIAHLGFLGLVKASWRIFSQNPRVLLSLIALFFLIPSLFAGYLQLSFPNSVVLIALFSQPLLLFGWMVLTAEIGEIFAGGKASLHRALTKVSGPPMFYIFGTVLLQAVLYVALPLVVFTVAVIASALLSSEKEIAAIVGGIAGAVLFIRNIGEYLYSGIVSIFEKRYFLAAVRRSSELVREHRMWNIGTITLIGNAGVFLFLWFGVELLLAVALNEEILFDVTTYSTPAQLLIESARAIPPCLANAISCHITTLAYLHLRATNGDLTFFDQAQTNVLIPVPK